jgi:hypothetical protein
MGPSKPRLALSTQSSKSGEKMRKLCLAASLSLFTVLPLATMNSAYAQNTTSGDISGTVTDPTGAVIPGAAIVLVNKDTGAVLHSTTDNSGSYRASLLKPGSYTVTVTHDGFQTTSFTIMVTPGQVATGDLKLALGNNTTTVEVNEAVPLLTVENADLSTTFSQEQVQDLPNPGNDLTYIAQTAPGVVMNTQGGYGNFSAFGLPATSNTFTVNGGYENDPFLNLSNSGASNLLLGNNDVSEVTVTSNAYTAQFGGLGGAQVNEISRSGSNRFHGDATYYWNGSDLNANNYFNNQTGVKKPRSNANQWSGSIGGPIRKDSTFFFFNTEGLRVIIPVDQTVYAPSTLYINQTLANVAATQGAAVAASFKSFFNEYQKNPLYATAAADASDPNVVTFRGQGANFAHEVLYTGRIDQNIGKKDLLFAHVKVDKGVQPTFTSLLDPIFDTNSPQPGYEGQLSETHTFSPNITNQFVFASIYYRAIFTNTNAAAASAIAPFSIIFTSGDLATNTLNSTPGGEDYAFPQGRNVTGYQFIDDLSIVRGKHTLKTGFSMRRDDVTDYGPQVLTTPLVFASEASFEAGNAVGFEQNFPTRSTQPIALYTMGIYGQDEWKVAPNLTLVLGMRFEHNSNPKCLTNCFATLANDFNSLPTSTALPYSSLISTGHGTAFTNFQKVAYEPRIGFSWAPFGAGSHTQVRGGFGMFADSFPAQITDNLLNNAPNNIPIVLGPYLTGAGANAPVYPAAAGSYSQQASGSNIAFQNGFKSNLSFNQLSTISGFSAPGFTNATRIIKDPTYEEYSLEIQQQLNRTAAIYVGYTGNHGYHEPVLNSGVNAYNAGGTGFASLPTMAPNQNFSAVTQIYSGASSNYNGVVVSFVNHAKVLTTQINYSYSHALDEISNGGFNGFSGNSINPDNPNLLRQNYGNADYDTRHYLSGNYVFNLPYYGGPHALTDGWQITGDAFHSSGLPFTFTDSVTAGGNLGNYTAAALFAKQTVAHLPNKCSGNGATYGIACAAAGDVTSATDFGQQGRNQVFGPDYTDTDITVSKAFPLSLHPKTGEGFQLRLGVQIFNVLNHPNFGQPLHDSADGSAEGTITSTVNPPTSILGSFLGGDASPRLVQLKAKLSF